MPKSEANRKSLAGRLKEAREYLNLSQEEVARQVSLPRTAISQIESGQRRVEALELKKLAEIYERPVAFFTGEISGNNTLPTDVEHLARTASKLSEQDRQELRRFAEFLSTRSELKGQR
jgi:transcriptional regulator with XRE-family HTH domain